MRKLSAFFILAIMLLGLTLPASAVVSNVLQTFDTQAQDASCSHPSYELAGETWTETTTISLASHRIATMQHGYCTKCYKKTITVIISSKIENHVWFTYNDEHKSDGEHIYYQKCRACDAQTQYTRACGGLHMLCIDDLTK